MQGDVKHSLSAVQQAFTITLESSSVDALRIAIALVISF